MTFVRRITCGGVFRCFVGLTESTAGGMVRSWTRTTGAATGGAHAGVKSSNCRWFGEGVFVTFGTASI
jgi:hypothetical protein